MVTTKNIFLFLVKHNKNTHKLTLCGTHRDRHVIIASNCSSGCEIYEMVVEMLIVDGNDFFFVDHIHAFLLRSKLDSDKYVEFTNL